MIPSQDIYPSRFTYPFRYVPNPLIAWAANKLIEKIENTRCLASLFQEGKMMGVLMVRTSSSDLMVWRPFSEHPDVGFIFGYSGPVRISSDYGFVTPILDIMAPNSHFLREQEKIDLVNRRIRELESSDELSALRDELDGLLLDARLSLKWLEEDMKSSKALRSQVRRHLTSGRDSGDFEQNSSAIACQQIAVPESVALRYGTTDPEELLQKFAEESSFQKAELRRQKKRFEAEQAEVRAKIEALKEEISSLKRQRREMSDILQRWIFDNYIVYNGLGESASIWEVFEDQGLVPPGGTGDCAAPKLLNYAFTHGMTPLAMGEFWYGDSPEGSVRRHGAFYPSCSAKCGPLLPWMLRGLDVDCPFVAEGSALDGIVGDSSFSGCIEGSEVRVLYEDEAIVVAVKPAGMLSVPGKNGQVSLQESFSSEVYCVHRLDMDTSGVIVYAKTPEAQANLQAQFEGREVKKFYLARLLDNPVPGSNVVVDANPTIPSGIQSISSECSSECNSEAQSSLMSGDCLMSGTINLPISPDYEDRPRQKVDFDRGKEAITEFWLLRDSYILLSPITGRTHQLRIHLAHQAGLGTPIQGDLLYGGYTVNSFRVQRLYLHAASITFRHPISGLFVTFSDFNI